VIPPLVTPLRDSDELDVGGLDRLIEHVAAGGVHGLFVLGTTGEGPSLSHRLRREMVERACRLAAGRLPVLVGITDASPCESNRLAGFAADAGAAAVVVAPPFYFPIEESDLAEYYLGLVPHLPLPAFLYNMPSHTKVNISPELVFRLLSLPNLIGLKDSATGATCAMAVREVVARERPDFSLLIGPEEFMIQGLRAGAHGGVCGGANAFPRLFVEAYEAIANAEHSHADTLQVLIERVADTIYRAAARNGGSSYAGIRAIKRVLAYLGLCSEWPSSPMQPLTEAQRRLIDEAADALMSLATFPVPVQQGSRALLDA
jgi:4-hydroxy-tetrahydrodipicolinate synthase